MLLIAFKLITYGTARVKTSEHVNLCISLYTKNCLYHNFIPILTKYFPICIQISMLTRRLIQWLCEDISVRRRVSQTGILCLFMPETRPSGDFPNMTRGDFTQSYLRNHLIKWLVHACSISYQLYIGYRYYLYTLFISIYYISIHHIYFYTFIVIQWCLSMYTVLSCNLHLFWLFLIIPIWWGPFIQVWQTRVCGLACCQVVVLYRKRTDSLPAWQEPTPGCK